MIKVIIIFLALINLSACSIQSSQLNFIKQMTANDNSADIPTKNWQALWGNQIINLYAINVGNQVIFADENINIFFKNQQIYKITGLLDDNNVLEIISSDLSLKYFLNRIQISLDSCDNKKNININDGDQKSYQTCYDKKSGTTYENYIITNNENLISSLRFNVHPDYAPLELSRK